MVQSDKCESRDPFDERLFLSSEEPKEILILRDAQILSLPRAVMYQNDMSAEEQHGPPFILQHDNHSLQHILTVANRQQLVSKSIPLKPTNFSMKHCPKVYELFQHLDLMKFFPQKLNLQDALCITSETSPISNCTSPSLLPRLVLHKIMAYDYRCRSVLLQNEGKGSTHYYEEKCGYYSDEFEEESDSDSDLESDDEASKHNINPVDCLLSVIHCANDVLRQELFSRLAKCQLAIPFLLPDPFSRNRQLTFPLWAMRSIIKEWKCPSVARW